MLPSYRLSWSQLVFFDTRDLQKVFKMDQLSR